MKKKLLSMLTTLVMVVSLCGVLPAVTASADSTNYIVYSSVLGTNIPAKQYVNPNSYFYVSNKVPTCPGYTFLYWKSYGGNIYYPGEYCYFGGGALILTAIWEADTYLVHYDANGGEYPPDDQIKTHGNSLKLSSDVPQRDGYVFVGWGKTANTTTVSYKPKAYYTTNASITLYAIWKKAYTINYLANGGINAPSEQTKIHGESIKLSTAKPTRTGYTFIGWSISPYETTAMYQAGGKYTDNASITLYAVWAKNSSTNKTNEDNKIINKESKSKKTKSTDSKKSAQDTKPVAKDKSAAQKAMKQAKITKLTAKSKAKKKITVSWKKVSKAVGYQVQVSTNKKFKKSKIVFNKELKKTKLNIKGKKIKSKKTYYVRVRAYATYKDKNGVAQKVYSAWNKQIRKVKVK